MAAPPAPTARASHREILALTIPAIGALGSDPLLSLVDTAFVGRLGVRELAALGVCTAVFTTLFVLFNFLTYGTTGEVARLRGARAPEEAARYALQALWIAVGGGVAVMLGLWLAGGWVVQAIGARGEVVDLSLSYLHVRALAGVPVLVVAVGHGAFRGLKDTRTPLAITVGINLVNIPLSWALIYPVGLGIAGAAWGTVVAQSAGALLFVVLARRRFVVPSLRIDPPAMRAIVRISRDLFLRTAALLSAMLITTVAATRMGVTSIAAHQVARELWGMLALVLDGFAIAGQALIGAALGAGRPDIARADARRLMAWGLGGGTAIGLGYLSLAGVLPGLFSTDPAVLAAVGAVWSLIALMQPACGVAFVLDGILMGARDFRYLLGSTAFASLGILAPLAVLALVADLGLVGIWWAMVAMMAVRLATLLWRVRGERWTTRIPPPRWKESR